MEKIKYLTVEALNKYLKYRFDNDKNLFKVYLKGEVSNFKKNINGHLYFTLKDEKSQISCIMFSKYNNTKLEIKDGMKLLVMGKISLYEPSGTYQIYLEEINLDGIGDLYIAFTELKNKLEKEGYFEQKHKKQIPKFPKKIGVITSSTGAVVKDIINTTNRRYKNCEIIVYPSSVQGENSKRELIENVKKANLDALVDVIIIGRGGGSIEDLWSFNDEELCKTIFHSNIPIISAVGHETDFTICDFVCDLRAPTPTAAAELATPNTVDLMDMIHKQVEKLNVSINNLMDSKKVKVLHLVEIIYKSNPKLKFQNLKEKFKNVYFNLESNYNKIITKKNNDLKMLSQKVESFDLHLKIQREKEKMDYLSNTLNRNIKNVFSHKANSFEIQNNKLKTLNPLFIMEKGFSVIFKDDRIIKSIHEVEMNDEVKIVVKDGAVFAKILKKEGK